VIEAFESKAANSTFSQTHLPARLPMFSACAFGFACAAMPLIWCRALCTDLAVCTGEVVCASQGGDTYQTLREERH